jgi:DNA-binding response OmpR family regulator
MTKPLKILVVEDHDALRETLVELLCEQGYAAEGVFSAEEVDVTGSLQLPDIYIIDLNLPGEDGLSLTRRLRVARPGAAIVIVSARSDLTDRLDGYHTGADVYLTKPFDPEELMAVVGSIAQRLRPLEAQKGLRLDRRRQVLMGASLEVPLSQSEVRLLSGLVQAKDQTLTYQQTAECLNLEDLPANRPTLNARLSQLRKKLQLAGAEEPTLRSIRKQGYSLCIALQLL